MSDYERYSDYNNPDDDSEELHPYPLWFRILRKAVKWLFIAICLLTVGLLLFRMSLLGWYPDSAKQLYMTPAIAEEYAKTGEVEVLIQKLLVPYESRKYGFFSADNMRYIKATGSLQCSIRVNRSAYAEMSEVYKTSLAKDRDDNLSFTLYYSNGEDINLSYTPTHVSRETHLFYDYYKICFDGIDTSESLPWYRLNIHLSGVADTEAEPTACIVVYENNEEYSHFTPYIPSKEELPS